VEVCRRAWTGEPFTYRGHHVDVRDVILQPAPPGPPEIWLGGWGQRSLERAGRLADGYLSPLGDLDDMLGRVDVLDQAAAAAGRPRPVPVATINLVSVSRDGRMPSGVLAGLQHMNKTYTEWYGSSSDEVGGRAVARLIQETQDMLAGTPAEVAGRLTPLVERLSRDRDYVLVAWLHYPGMPLPEARTHLELFATEVMPRLREAAS
jgi:alkanesulfonate monooxygenase SsuD/methylene tetrahydromethanopterin reductase-like flavin-dependent oxidoreductase (luciferase family)